MSSGRRFSIPPLRTADLDRGPAPRGISSPALSPRVAEEFPTDQIPKKRYLRSRSDRGPKWHKDYSQLDHFAGRVLVIDFVKQDHCRNSVRKVAAQEIYDFKGLQKLYNNPQRSDEAVLRVFHVQNADWATRFLLRKFNVENNNDMAGREFGRFVRRKRPERKGKRPFMTGKAWKAQYDPWRGLSMTSFGFDYLKHYPVKGADQKAEDGDDSRKMMELNCFDDEDNPVCGYDVHGQRFSCYLQHKQDFPEQPTDLEEETIDDSPDKTRDKKHHASPDAFDNGNAVLIFDNSRTGNIGDTLVDARGTWEKRWRRLPFFLAYESRDLVATDEQLAYQCSRIILEDMFHALSGQWETFLDLAMDHISILEDKIYEQPADETRAPELWMNSSLWLKVERLIYVHIDLIKDLRSRLEEVTADIESDESWLNNVGNDFDQHSKIVTEDLVKPTENFISLLYQSISIRDSRHNIRLSISMWRLSWITFIFLPLTFFTGIFGMNVDVFEDNPSIKWYFVSAIPFMIGVLVGWYILKHVFRLKSDVLSYKGIYENFFNEMETQHPKLWDRRGPRDYFMPRGRLDKFRWKLIKHWTAPERTIRRTEEAQKSVDPANDLGTLNRFKRYLMRRWTSGLDRPSRPSKSSSSSLEDGDTDTESSESRSIFVDGMADAAEVLVVPATPAMTGTFDNAGKSGTDDDTRVGRLGHPDGGNAPGRLSSQSAERSSSAGRTSGSILVEEEDWQWLSQRGQQGKKWAWRTSSSRERSLENKRETGTKDDKGGEAAPEGSKDNDNDKQTPSPEGASSPGHQQQSGPST